MLKVLKGQRWSWGEGAGPWVVARWGHWRRGSDIPIRAHPSMNGLPSSEVPDGAGAHLQPGQPHPQHSQPAEVTCIPDRARQATGTTNSGPAH